MEQVNVAMIVTTLRCVAVDRDKRKEIRHKQFKSVSTRAANRQGHVGEDASLQHKGEAANLKEMIVQPWGVAYEVS